MPPLSDWVDFFEPFFISRLAVEQWVAQCEELFPVEDAPANNSAKIMMHQTQRLISLADDLQQIRPHADPLALLFFLICAEHIAKLDAQYKGTSESSKHVHLFFDKFITPHDRNIISNAFIQIDSGQPLSFDKAIDLLYKKRCDVAHEGDWYDFAFHDGVTSLVNNHLEVRIGLKQIRDIVVRGCIKAISGKLPAG